MVLTRRVIYIKVKSQVEKRYLCSVYYVYDKYVKQFEPVMPKTTKPTINSIEIDAHTYLRQCIKYSKNV